MKKSFILKIFEGFSIKRWNDLVCPFDVIEMDKPRIISHKMPYDIYAYYDNDDDKKHQQMSIREKVYKLRNRIIRYSTFMQIAFMQPSYSKIIISHLYP